MTTRADWLLRILNFVWNNQKPLSPPLCSSPEPPSVKAGLEAPASMWGEERELRENWWTFPRPTLASDGKLLRKPTGMNVITGGKFKLESGWMVYSYSVVERFVEILTIQTLFFLKLCFKKTCGLRINLVYYIWILKFWLTRLKCPVVWQHFK